MSADNNFFSFLKLKHITGITNSTTRISI